MPPDTVSSDESSAATLHPLDERLDRDDRLEVLGEHLVLGKADARVLFDEGDEIEQSDGVDRAAVEQRLVGVDDRRVVLQQAFRDELGEIPRAWPFSFTPVRTLVDVAATVRGPRYDPPCPSR